MSGSLELAFDLACSPAVAFAAWTEADRITRWWREPGVYRTIAWSADVRAGGAWRATFEGDDGQTFGAEGQYIAVEPPGRLVWTWRSSWAPETESRIAMDFAPAGTSTRLRLVQTGFEDGERAEQEESWRQIVGWLAADLTTPGVDLTPDAAGGARQPAGAFPGAAPRLWCLWSVLTTAVLTRRDRRRRRKT